MVDAERVLRKCFAGTVDGPTQHVRLHRSDNHGVCALSVTKGSFKDSVAVPRPRSSTVVQVQAHKCVAHFWFLCFLRSLPLQPPTTYPPGFRARKTWSKSANSTGRGGAGGGVSTNTKRSTVRRKTASLRNSAERSRSSLRTEASDAGCPVSKRTGTLRLIILQTGLLWPTGG